MKIKEFIKNERVRQKLGIYKLSKLCGVPATTIDNWERRDVNPTFENVVSVLNVLGYKLVIEKKN